mgnify:CR=1 FL=1
MSQHGLTAGRPALAAGLAILVALPAAAVDCPVNPLDAHNAAKLRGWTFKCQTSASAIGVTGSFVTYPPAAIGCTFKTPPVLAGVNHLGNGQFFISGSAPGGRPQLKNGWQVKQIEIGGGQWNDWSSGNPAAPSDARVVFRTNEAPKPSRTYNFQLGKLVLTHASSSCAKALDEAF